MNPLLRTTGLFWNTLLLGSAARALLWRPYIPCGGRGVQLREDLSGVRGDASRDSRHKLGSREEQTFFNQAPAFKCHNSENRFKRKETERFRAFIYHELIQRDKVNLKIFWLKDESLEDSENFVRFAKLYKQYKVYI